MCPFSLTSTIYSHSHLPLALVTLPHALHQALLTHIYHLLSLTSAPCPSHVTTRMTCTPSHPHLPSNLSHIGPLPFSHFSLFTSVYFHIFFTHPCSTHITTRMTCTPSHSHLPSTLTHIFPLPFSRYHTHDMYPFSLTSTIYSLSHLPLLTHITTRIASGQTRDWFSFHWGIHHSTGGVEHA